LIFKVSFQLCPLIKTSETRQAGFATLHIAAKGNGKGVGFHNITYIRV